MPISERNPDGMVTGFKFNVFALFLAPIYLVCNRDWRLSRATTLRSGRQSTRRGRRRPLSSFTGCSSGVVLTSPLSAAFAFVFPLIRQVFAILLICDLIRSGSKIAAYWTRSSVPTLLFVTCLTMREDDTGGGWDTCMVPGM